MTFVPERLKYVPYKLLIAELGVGLVFECFWVTCAGIVCFLFVFVLGLK